ncbi:MAG: ferredoxin family protein [Bacillota bacterium]|nr:ferredoxin family protein [Bacillota bacterium]
MSIKIDKDKCVRCGKCLEVCPGSLIYKDENGKAYIKYENNCWGCTACLKECGVHAIKYYLGADIGGNGGYLYTEGNKEYLNWHIVDKDGEEQIITINRKESNKY